VIIGLSHKEIIQSGRTAPFYREDATPDRYIALAPALTKVNYACPRAFLQDQLFEARAKAAVRSRGAAQRIENGVLILEKNKDAVKVKLRGYLLLPILKTLVPQVAQVPLIAGLPFFIVMLTGSFTSVFALHLTQYASIAPLLL
jgi:hypothetical protein